MKIKLLISRAGANFAQSVGDVIEVGDAEAIRIIEAGQALPDVVEVTERAVPKKTAERRGG